MQNLKQILFQKFGFQEFRADQERILESLLHKKESCLALMPTGMGKSLCFQLPASVSDGLVVVLTPLIALMEDQVRKAREHEIRATYLSSTLSSEERAKRLNQVARGEINLLFVTPERFRKTEFLEVIQKQKIELLAVDEAHCISSWGHDFRPDYSRLGEIRESLKNPLTLALTATATPLVQKDILKQLNLETALIFDSGIERPNLSLNVHSVYGFDEKVRAIIGLHHQNPGSQIVYTSLIQTLYKISEQLTKMNVNHLIYHGDLEPGQRRRNQKIFIEEENKLMIATPAFGLGIDKPNIRMITHTEMPSSLEAYYQEVGRAGRDGKPSSCNLLYDQDDVSIQMDFIKWATPDPGFIRSVYRLIEKGGAGLQMEGIDFLRKQMNFYNTRDYRVETCVNLLFRWGSLVEDKNTKFGYKAVLEPEGEWLDETIYKQRVKVQNEKLLKMVQWSQMEEGCRLLEVYNYFGHHGVKCGICDLCIGQMPSAVN